MATSGTTVRMSHSAGEASSGRLLGDKTLKSLPYDGFLPNGHVRFAMPVAPQACFLSRVISSSWR